ncbi:MAG TPA: hypothetical protein VFD17_04855 [Clostridia bacterium]|nr:hypothetical protein [Clostridia bacterium]
MARKAITVLLALLICISFVACKNIIYSKDQDNGEQKRATLGNGGTKDKSKLKGETVVRKDEKNLIEVHIEKGEAWVYFNLEKWEEVFALSEIKAGGGLIPCFNTENWREILKVEDTKFMGDNYCGPFPIKGLSGKVRDANITQIEELDFFSGCSETIPTIFLLMEDGTVEFTYGDMFHIVPDFPALESLGPLLWVEDIESLIHENDGEGIGEMTVYAVDAKGNKYDLRIPSKFRVLSLGMSWVSNELAREPDFSPVGPAYCAVLDFSEDGTVILEKGWVNDVPVKYKGNYRITMGEGEMRPGMMIFDLYLDSSAPNAKKEIHGSYFAEIYYGMELELYPGEGELLYEEGMKSHEPFKFVLGYNPFHKENKAYIQDIGDYLLTHVEKAREMVEEYGMSLLYTEEYSEVFGENCRDIWLGTNHNDKFTREILYTVSDNGTIYEYDALEPAWNTVWGGLVTKGDVHKLSPFCQIEGYNKKINKLY